MILGALAIPRVVCHKMGKVLLLLVQGPLSTPTWGVSG